MKASHLLWLLAVALAANAQTNGTDTSASADAGGSSAAPASPSPPPSSPPPSSPPPTSPPPTSPPPTSPPPTSPPTTPTPTPTPTPPPQSPSFTVDKSTSVDSDGSTVIVDVTSTLPFSSTSSSSATNSAGQDTSNGGGGGSSTLSTGGIIGLAVAGGTALVCLIGFLVWKFTHKRGADFDDNENIKWPELNAHSSEGGDTHAMPVTSTGRAGFIDGEMSRAPSVANTYAASTSDFHSDDPYAVPPLPHMNPGLAQPYHDDPNAAAAGGYYDPYRGPVPQTFNEATHGAPPADWGGNHEAIPMTQMAGAGGRGSPAPGMMYADARTMSPGPQAAYAGAGRTPSPGPQAAFAGRASPGPQHAYSTGRASPGPGPAYGGV